MKNAFESVRLSVTEDDAKKWHEAAEESIAYMKSLGSNAIIESLGDTVAASKLATHAIDTARRIVEQDALSLIDVMDVAFNETSGALKKLRESNKKLSEESAFIGTSLNMINRKKDEIEEYAAELERLNSAIDAFKVHVDSGLFDMVKKLVIAIDK
jgi:hypothetical protein